MGRDRDWICRSVYRRALSGCVVDAVRDYKGIFAFCGLPNRRCDRSLDFANARFDLKPMESAEAILPDLQSCVLCEDVRCEFNGMNTLVGVLNVIAAPSLPINYLRLCIWTRWCSGTGKFKQRSRIVGVDEQNVLA